MKFVDDALFLTRRGKGAEVNKSVNLMHSCYLVNY